MHRARPTTLLALLAAGAAVACGGQAELDQPAPPPIERIDRAVIREATAPPDDAAIEKAAAAHEALGAHGTTKPVEDPAPAQGDDAPPMDPGTPGVDAAPAPTEDYAAADAPTADAPTADAPTVDDPPQGATADDTP